MVGGPLTYYWSPQKFEFHEKLYSASEFEQPNFFKETKGKPVATGQVHVKTHLCKGQKLKMANI